MEIASPNANPSQCAVPAAMSSGAFKKYGNALVEWGINYMATLNQRNPTTHEKPGWLRRIVPAEPPQKKESFDLIMNDLEAVACNGMAHWQHRQFFAYFPAGNSWPSILGDVFSNMVAANGTNWCACPVITELETLMMDWCCKFLGLPEFFLSSYTNPNSEGQGILQCSASEAIFYSMIWARQDALDRLRAKYPNKPKATLLNMLVAYCNNECHCCVERAAMMGSIRIRKLKADSIGVIRSHTLKNAIEEDIKKGRVPFFHCAIIGSTGVTSCDDLMEVGPVCAKYKMWLHVDAAYAGSAFVLPEMAHLKQGYQYVWSTNINTNKWMITNFEASLHWVRYRRKAVDAFAGPRANIAEYGNGVGPDLKHYGVAATRRLRAIKLWFVVRNYGVEGIRRYIRNHINLAKLFEVYVRRDSRFELCGGPFRFGLVAFRLKGYNSLTSRLLDALNASHKIHMVSSHFHDKVVIRFALCAEDANERDIDKAWRTIDEYTSVILREYEKEHAEDLAMKTVYRSQHIHDDLLDIIGDENTKKEEDEAADVIKALDTSTERDSFISAGHTSANDGSWGHAEDDVFEKFDRWLQENPQATWVPPDVDDEENPDEEGQSMLFLSTIAKTVKNLIEIRNKRHASV